MDDVDLDVVKTQLAQSYARALQSAAREHIHSALLELDVEVRRAHGVSQPWAGWVARAGAIAQLLRPFGIASCSVGIYTEQEIRPWRC